MLLRLGQLHPGYQRLLIVAICAVLYCLWIYWMPLTEIDETRFCESTREMVHSGHYIIPTFNAEPRYQKPILYYWIQAGAVRVFGPNEAAARFPSALAAILLVLLLHGFLLRWLPACVRADDPGGKSQARGAALLAALSVATVPFLIVWSRAATTDMTLTLFISITLLALLQAELAGATNVGRQAVQKWYLLAAVTAALGFLTKGPIGVIVPGLVWLCYHIFQRSLPREVRRVPWLGALALFVLIAAPWYSATYVVVGPAFLKHFFLTENIGRFSSVMEGHGASTQRGLAVYGAYALRLLMYWPFALVLLFPISPFILHEACTPCGGNRTLSQHELLTRIRRFSWCWVLAVIVLFSLSRTQLPSYIQSIIVGAGILFAVHVLGRGSAQLAGGPSPVQEDAKPCGTMGWGSLCEVFLLALIGTGLAYELCKSLLTNSFTLVNWVPPALLPPQQSVPVALLLGVASGLFVLGSVVVWLFRRPIAFISWVWLSWTLVIAVLALGVGPLAVRSNYALMAQAGASLRALPAEMPVLAYFSHTPETLVYYARRHIEFCSLDDEYFLTRLSLAMVKMHQVYVVTNANGLRVLKKHHPAHTVRQFGTSIFIVSAADLPPSAHRKRARFSRL